MRGAWLVSEKSVQILRHTLPSDMGVQSSSLTVCYVSNRKRKRIVRRRRRRRRSGGPLRTPQGWPLQVRLWLPKGSSLAPPVPRRSFPRLSYGSAMV